MNRSFIATDNFSGVTQPPIINVVGFTIVASLTEAAIAKEWTITIEGKNEFGDVCRKELRSDVV